MGGVVKTSYFVDLETVVTNRKLHMRFWLAPRSTTLN